MIAVWIILGVVGYCILAFAGWCLCAIGDGDDMNRMARREWNRLAPKMEKLGLLTDENRLAVWGYCRAYARARTAPTRTRGKR